MARHSDDEKYSDREVASRKETRTRRTTSTSKTEKPKKKKAKRPSGGININMSNSNNIGAAPVMPKSAIPATTPEIEEEDDDEVEQERVRMERLTIEVEEEKKKKRSEKRAVRRALEEAKKKVEESDEEEEEEEEITTVTKKKKKQMKETEDETRTITTRTKISESETEDEEFARCCPHVSWVTSESTSIKQPGVKRALMNIVDAGAWDRDCQASDNRFALARGLTMEQYKQRYGRDFADNTLIPMLRANHGSGFLFSRAVRGPVFSPTYIIPPVPVFNPVFTYGVGYGAYGGSVMGSQTRMREFVETRTETITSGGRVVEVPEESEEEEIVTKVVKKVKKSKKTES